MQGSMQVSIYEPGAPKLANPEASHVDLEFLRQARAGEGGRGLRGAIPKPLPHLPNRSQTIL